MDAKIASATDWISQRPALVAMLVAALLLWSRLSAGALRQWDEAWYAETSREMLQAGSWLTPLWNGEPFFDKPPLTFWATASAFYLFGVGEIQARLFSFVCAIVTIGLVTQFAASQAKRFRVLKPGLLGIVAGLALTAIPEFARYATRGQTDAPLTLFVVGQLMAFWLARENPRWRIVEGLCFGLALMTKGSAAGLAIVVELAFFAIVRECQRKQFWGWLGACALGLVLAIPWHLQQFLAHGEPFLREYGAKHFGRFFHEIAPPVETGPPPRVGYYLDFLLRKQQWWGWTIVGLTAIAAIHVVCSAWRRQRRPLAEPNHCMLLASCWTAVMPLALSCSRAKWSWYLVPMYPGAALLAATLLAQTKCWQCPKIMLSMAIGFVLLSAGEARFDSANRLLESEIRQLASSVQKTVPENQIVYSLQAPSWRQSVYPITCAFYCQRPTHALKGIDQLNRVAVSARSNFYLLAHHKFVEDTVQRMESNGTECPWTATMVELCEPIGLFVVSPKPQFACFP